MSRKIKKLSLSSFGLCLIPALILVPLSFVSAALADDEDLRSIRLFDGADAEVVSSGRSPRPASQIAENVTVITAQEIDAINAHTLADILNVLAGVQLQTIRTPGGVVNFTVQGSKFNHLLVLLDNVPINNLSDNFPDIASIPAQIIERVEMVKGAASSSWGSALGGVVNVITKSPPVDALLTGEVAASLGKSGTADGRAEVGGVRDRLGYYLSLGKLRSDGLLPGNNVDLDSAYGKVQYDLSGRGTLTLSSLYTTNSRGDRFEPFQVDQESRQILTTLALQLFPTDRISIGAAVKNNDLKNEMVQQATGFSRALRGDDSLIGVSLNAGWRGDLQRVSAGLDYEHVSSHIVDPLIHADYLNRSANRFGFYLNDVVTLGDLAIIPSLRYDHTGTEGDLFSPSLGVTYALTENSVLRGYTGRGYSLTSLANVDSTEKVWTSQVGMESGEIPFLWLKGSLFRNETWNVTVADRGTGSLAKVRQFKQGGELELRTLPIFSTSLSTSYTYIHASYSQPGVDSLVPRHTAKLALSYDDSRYLRAVLIGSFIDWSTPQEMEGHSGVIFDLHLGKRLLVRERLQLELFLSVRNLFNARQYVDYPSTGRWAEAGLRCRF